MKLFTQRPPALTPQPKFVADPMTGLLHRMECPDRPVSGIPFVDKGGATRQGYGLCWCTEAASVAPTERIRLLLSTTARR
jgi:hypothetical protein